MKEKRETDQYAKARITNLEKEIKIKAVLTADLTTAETAVLDLHPLGLVKRIQI